MRIGFTGTSKGMTRTQAARVAEVLAELTDLEAPGYPHELHHGDCVGADAQAHLLAQCLGLGVVIHPPLDDKARAFMDGRDVTILPLKPYLARDLDIALATTVLVAAPDGEEKAQPRSGTWATVRYARMNSKPVWLVWPDGRLEKP